MEITYGDKSRIILLVPYNGSIGAAFRLYKYFRECVKTGFGSIGDRQFFYYSSWKRKNDLKYEM